MNHLGEIFQPNPLDGPEESCHPLAALRRCANAIFPIGEDIQSEPAIVPQPFDPVDEFQVFHQVPRPQDHIVIPISVVVVQVKVIEFAVAGQQGGSLRRILAGRNGMAHVQQHANFVEPLKEQQHLGGGVHKTMGAGLVEFVFHQHAHLVMMTRAGRQTLAHPFPGFHIVGLEGIVESILAGPHVHIRAAQFRAPSP